jgi:N-acetylglucosaminyl-diphospho-decaprenol L-rhamnosyltransferase
MVSVIVVHFRGQDRIQSCVRSCLDDPEVEEVIVVDNEGIGRRLRRALPHPRVRILQMNHNAGYGRAANAGLAASRGDAVLVLNQDAQIGPGAAAALLEAGATSEAWLVGPRLLGSDGAEATPKERFPLPLGWAAGTTSGPGWRARPWIPGAAMLFMPGHTGLRFDPRLFMFGEDEELCWRVWASGGRVVEAEGAQVVHEGGTAASARWTTLGIAGRTVLNRARFIRWHRGRRAASTYLADAVGRAVARRLGGGRG